MVVSESSVPSSTSPVEHGRADNPMSPSVTPQFEVLASRGLTGWLHQMRLSLPFTKPDRRFKPGGIPRSAPNTTASAIL